jgi:glycosidase
MFRFSPTEPASKGPWGQIAWHKSPVSNEYYYGVFWSGMPDLNYENAMMREEAKKIATFWLKDMGVDGFRLDAIPYLVEEGTVLSGSPKTHEVMRDWSAHVRSVKPNAYTVGEVWDSVGAMLPYYPHELDSYFAFELSDAIFAAVKTGSAQKLFPGYLRLERSVNAQRYSPFLRNHDQSRTMTVLNGDVARAKMATTLLLTLPGLPFIYYGEEIGMTGDKPDERLRTPMQWAAGPGGGFTGAKAWQPFQGDSLKVTVEAQTDDPTSLLNLHRRLIHLRAEKSALGSGTLAPLTTGNDAVAAFLRRDDKKVVMVLANLTGTTIENLAVTSDSAAVPKGKFTPRELLGGGTAAPIVVDNTGWIRNYVPIRSLAPFTAYIFEF